GLDRALVDEVVLVGALGLLVLTGERVGTLLDDVDLEVGTGDRRLLARRGSFLFGVCVCVGLGDRLSSGFLGDRLGGRLFGGLGRSGLGGRSLLRSSRGRLLFGGAVVGRLVGHALISSVCGFCASCGWSVPAYTLS